MKEKHKMRRCFLGTVVAAALVAVMGGASVWAAAPNAWTQRFTIIIQDPVSLSLSVGDVFIDNVAPNSVNPATGSMVATVRSGWSLGYTLAASGDTDLECELDSNYKIPALVTPGTLTTNTWGVGVGADALTAPSSWLGVTSGGVKLAETAAPSSGWVDSSTPGPGDAYAIFFGLKVDASKMACDYSGTVTFTAAKK